MSDISVGIDLFNDAEFFEAHDFFENLWNESSPGDKFFYQGLVHVSVASFHLISGNLIGALSQYSKGKMKVEKYVPMFLNVDVKSLIFSVEKTISELQNQEGVFNPEFLVSNLPKIKYIK